MLQWKQIGKDSPSTPKEQDPFGVKVSTNNPPTHYCDDGDKMNEM